AGRRYDLLVRLVAVALDGEVDAIEELRSHALALPALSATVEPLSRCVFPSNPYEPVVVVSGVDRTCVSNRSGLLAFRLALSGFRFQISGFCSPVSGIRRIVYGM